MRRIQKAGRSAATAEPHGGILIAMLPASSRPHEINIFSYPTVYPNSVRSCRTCPFRSTLTPSLLGVPSVVTDEERTLCQAPGLQLSLPSGDPTCRSLVGTQENEGPPGGREDVTRILRHRLEGSGDQKSSFSSAKRADL